MTDKLPHVADDKESVNIPICEADLEGIRDGASEAYFDHGNTHAYWELKLIARIDQLQKALAKAEEIARTHGRLWGENRGNANPSTVPQEEIANAIAALVRAWEDDKMADKKSVAHTPGPWKISMQGGGKCQGGNDYGIRVDCPNSDEGRFAIAMVRRKGRNQIARANACLIAAAPEMYAMLKEMHASNCDIAATFTKLPCALCALLARIEVIERAQTWDVPFYMHEV
jgi:hypothetical protein